MGSCSTFYTLYHRNHNSTFPLFAVVRTLICLQVLQRQVFEDIGSLGLEIVRLSLKVRSHSLGSRMLVFKILASSCLSCHVLSYSKPCWWLIRKNEEWIPICYVSPMTHSSIPVIR